MPELPEVEGVVRGLQERVQGKVLHKITELRPGTIVNHAPRSLTADTLGKVLAVTRRGKYILITLPRLQLVGHLRMTGKFVMAEPVENLSSHTRAYFDFVDGSRLLYHDPRTFGGVSIHALGEVIPAIARLGPEPLSADFSADYLRNALANRTGPIKNLLLNQTIVAGLGNIYVCEALYRAGIHPAHTPKQINRKRLATLIQEIKLILQEAIKLGGTTISDYRQIDDKSGQFQNFLQVYGRTKTPEGTPVLKLKQAGRTTWYCPVRQG